ncbi:restriction endonuclease subunit S [Gemmiger formicilis]|uniref:restriction endonuclease subunit S n=1 Tax=Gemmiger formicilis TaxID=745368 RepID=UPI0039905F43
MREMKDSGIEWVGQFPNNWKLKKGKYLFKQHNNRGNLKCLQLLSPSQKFGVIPQTLLEELTTQNVVKVSEKANLNDFKTVHVGDFCISLRSFQGGFEYSRYEGVVSPAYQIFSAIGDNLCDGYYRYLFKDKSFIDKMNSYTMTLRDGKNIAFDDFGNTYIPVPPKSEQEKIANFLDSKCSEIDAISADIQKEIEILEQYKRSVITEAVTKGLNPDVEMKDSGIEWVGNIPVHWDTIPIRYLFAECRLKNILNQEKTALKFTYGTIIKKTNFDSDSDEYVANTMTNYTVVYPGTIMINGLNLNYDFVSQRVGLVKDRGAITSAYLAIVPGSRVVSEYANYQLKSWDYAKAFHNMGTGVRKTLDFSELGKKYFVTPSIEEQSKIVAFLDSKCKEIEAIIASKKQQLTVIDSYKKSLIYEYVTGKKEVI